MRTSLLVVLLSASLIIIPAAATAAPSPELHCVSGDAGVACMVSYGGCTFTSDPTRPGSIDAACA